MKKKTLILFLCILSLGILAIWIYTHYSRESNIDALYEKAEQVYLLQTSSIRTFGKYRNNFKYYDEKGKLIKTESFTDTGDVSYNSIDDKYIYSYGPGGLYKTDFQKMKTTKLSLKNINIVKFFNNQMYYYVNVGYRENRYFSQICNEEECIDINDSIADFVVINDYYYMIGLEKLIIYKDEKLIRQIDLNDSPYQKFLYIDGRLFFLNEEKIYEIKEDEVIYFSENNIIQDMNFASFYISEKEQYIVDMVAHKLYILTLNDNKLNINKSYEISQKPFVSYSFSSNLPIIYSVDYQTNTLNVSSIDNINLVDINIQNRDGSVFAVYKIK